MDNMKKVLSKATAVKESRKGKDMGKKNVKGKSGFNTVEANAEKEYGSKEAGKRVAGAMFQKMRKAGKL